MALEAFLRVCQKEEVFSGIRGQGQSVCKAYNSVSTIVQRRAKILDTNS